jgi:hypothetical protein
MCGSTKRMDKQAGIVAQANELSSGRSYSARIGRHVFLGGASLSAYLDSRYSRNHHKIEQWEFYDDRDMRPRGHCPRLTAHRPMTRSLRATDCRSIDLRESCKVISFESRERPRSTQHIASWLIHTTA